MSHLFLKPLDFDTLFGPVVIKWQKLAGPTFAIPPLHSSNLFFKVFAMCLSVKK